MQYAPLDPALRQIRLLHLQPGTDWYVTCHFSIQTLNGPTTEYQALSYVWGTPCSLYVIIVEGVMVPITDNLWLALRNIRDRDQERVIWVDAVCINQSDDAERSDQIALMHSIYTQASSVTIWLGLPGGDTEPALEVFTKFCRAITDEGGPASAARLGKFLDINRESSDNDEREAPELRRAIAYIMSRAWWERTWTVQEFLLAKKTTFYCGRYHIDGTIIVQCAWHAMVYKPHQLSSATDMAEQFTVWVRMYQVFKPIVPMLAVKIQHMCLLEYVGIFRCRKATDPRDKLYGMLGLGTRNTAELLKPDYTLPVEAVYEAFVISLLTTTKNLDILSHLQTVRQQNLRLPTFVPDWTLDLQDAPGMDFEVWSARCSVLGFYDACLGSDVDFIASPGVLKLRGQIIDTIKRVATTEFDNESIDEWLSVAGIPSEDLDPGSASRKAFWLTMCAGLGVDPRTAAKRIMGTENKASPSDFVFRINADMDAALYDEFEEGMRTLNNGDLANALQLNSSQMLNAVNTATMCRRVTSTEGGRIGLVPINTRKGDVVALFTGGRVPIILRPETGKHYTVVGDAYVQGIMDGEAMRDLSELEYIELH